jgi:CHAD domain-containing protein
MRETELKFAVPTSFVVPAFDRDRTEVARVDKLEALELRAVYHDTPDLRLARNGVTLRYRSGEGEKSGWQLKLPVKGDVISREEMHFDGGPRRVPVEARDLVTAFVRSGRLNPVATLRSKRRRWALKGPDDDLLAEIMDDEVSILEGRRIVSRFREVELERRLSSDDQLNRIAEVLREGGASQSEPIPKAIRALGPEVTAPPDPPVVDVVDPEEPAHVAVRAALSRAVHRILTNDLLARLGDPEGVHQMRVGARRFRSDLRTFASLVDPEWAEGLHERARDLAGYLGNVRDLDVLIERFEKTGADIRSSLQPLFAELTTRRESAREELLQLLRSERYGRLLDELVEAATEPVFSDDAAGECGTVLPPLVEARWRKLSRPARGLSKDSPAEEFHDVRKKAKRARYAAEAVAPALGDRTKDAERFSKAVSKVQDVLGEHQDGIVAIQTIEDVLAGTRRTPRFAYAAGRLVERQIRAIDDNRASFFQIWDDVDKRRHRRWLKE